VGRQKKFWSHVSRGTIAPWGWSKAGRENPNLRLQNIDLFRNQPSDVEFRRLIGRRFPIRLELLLRLDYAQLLTLIATAGMNISR